MSLIQVNLTQPDEDGMAYISLGAATKIAKQKQGEVIYDLNDKGEVIGIEFLFAPKVWFIKGENNG